MNEWSPLREIIVGSLKGFEEHNHYSAYQSSNKFLNSLYDEAEEGLQTFQTLLEKEGVIVHRPHGFCYNVRDCAVVLGDTIVEGSMRYEEEYLWLKSLRPIFSERKFISGPKPTWNNESEPIFDGANLCKLGDNVLFAINETANKYGKIWLEENFPNINFSSIILEENISHIDTTIVPISSDTVLLNSNRLTENSLPSILNDWNKIWIKEEDLMQEGRLLGWRGASKWIGMNVLSLNENTLFISDIQVKLIELLESKNFNCIPTPLRYTQELCGGLHCCTLDLVRE